MIFFNWITLSYSLFDVESENRIHFSIKTDNVGISKNIILIYVKINEN